MIESMEGPQEGIVDRSFENLAPSDRMIAITRRRIIAAAQAHQKDGTVPSTVDRPELMRGARGGSSSRQTASTGSTPMPRSCARPGPAGFLLQAGNSGQKRRARCRE